MLVSLFNYIAYSQDKENLISPFEHSYIKFSPFSLLDIEPAFMIGYEYKINTNLNIQFDAAYVLTPTYMLVDGYNTTANGLKLKTTLKMPLEILPENHSNRFKYFGLELMFKYMYYDEKDIFVPREDRAFWEIMDIKTQKYIAALHFIYGVESFLSYRNNIITDFYGGVGIRYRYTINNAPAYIDYSPDFTFDFKGLIISATLGFKFGLGLK